MTKDLKKLPPAEGESLRSSRIPQYLAACTVSLAALSVGTTTAWTSPVLAELEAPDSPLPITVDQGTWIASINILATITTALLFGPLSNKIGRKYGITIFAIPMLLGFSLITIATNVLTIYLARILMGISTGGILAGGPTYITEISETKIRGRCGILFAVFLNFGLVFTNTLGKFMDYIALSTTLAMVPLLFIILCQFIPDSPIFFVMTGEMKKAETAIRWFHGDSCDIDSIFEELNNQVKNQTTHNNMRLTELLTSPVNRKTLFGCLGLLFFQQVCGENAIMSYTVLIFQSAGTNIDPHLESIIVSFVPFLMTVCVLKLINTMGRKILLMLSGGIMALCTGVLGFYFQLKNAGENVSYLNWLPLVSIMLFTAAYAMGYSSIPRVITSESVLPQFRSYVMASATTTGCIFSFAITKSFELMKETLGESGTFYLYTASSAMSIIWVYFLVSETHGKTLEEIQQKLNKRHQKKMIQVVV